jgi:hypothetical protein
MWFDMLESTTTEHAGERSVQVMTEADTKQCTMILAITTYGHKLTPLVTFRRKTLPKNKFLPHIVKIQERGRMTDKLIL